MTRLAGPCASLCSVRTAILAVVMALAGCVPRALTLGSDDASVEASLSADAGCAGAADCPPGQACDPVSETCSTRCAAGNACNGGCCNGATCVTGTSPSACGASGGPCAVCSGATPTCGDGQCTASCGDASTCGPGFCCTGDGGCTASSPMACGSGSACVDCSTSSAGHECLAGGVCGCNAASDCPSHAACDPQSKRCTNHCTATSPCNGGCCDAHLGTCQPGTWAADCGIDGGACITCTGVCHPGSRCVAATGTCGCYGSNANTDCKDNCGSSSYCMSNGQCH